MFTIDFKNEFNRCCCLMTRSQRNEVMYSYSGLNRRFRQNNKPATSLSESGSRHVTATSPGPPHRTSRYAYHPSTSSASSIESGFSSIRTNNKRRQHRGGKNGCNGNGNIKNSCENFQITEGSENQFSRLSMARS